MSEDRRCASDEDEDWPPPEVADSPPNGVEVPLKGTPSRSPETIAQMMEKWVAKLSPAEQKQWREHGTFIGWEPPAE